ncbi:MAG: hypothetical protein WEB58_21115 [Planctomycetaceae bacterium]
MSANPEASPSSAQPKSGKPRNPIERVVVWGGILILLVLVGIEYTARSAHTGAYDSLIEKLRTNEQAGNDVKTADVKAAVGGKAPRVEDVSGKRLLNGAKRMEVYSWFSLNPLTNREMYVYYGIGEDPDVVSISTEEETETIAPLTELDSIQLEDLQVFEKGLKKGVEDTKSDPTRSKEHRVFQEALDSLKKGAAGNPPPVTETESEAEGTATPEDAAPEKE